MIINERIKKNGQASVRNYNNNNERKYVPFHGQIMKCAHL